MIEQFYNELNKTFTRNIDELTTSSILAGRSKILLDKWDDTLDFLDNIIEKTNEIDDPSASDYIRLASAYLFYALMCSLDEKIG